MPGKTKSKRNQKSQTRRKSLPQKQKFLELKNNNNNIYDLGYRIENAKKAIGIDINGFNKIKKIIYTYLFKFNPKYRFYARENPDKPNRNVDTYKVSDKLANVYIITNNKYEFIDEIKKLPVINKRFIYRQKFYFKYLLQYLYHSDGSKVYKNKADLKTMIFIQNLKSKGIYLPIDAEIELAEQIKNMSKQELRKNIENDRALYQQIYGQEFPEGWLNSNSSFSSSPDEESIYMPYSIRNKYFSPSSNTEYGDDNYENEYGSSGSSEHNYDAYDLEDMGADY